MLPYRRTKALRIEDYRVQLADRPGWVWGTTRLPREGEQVFCAAGLGTVRALGGKTGNGSRLVEIGLTGSVKHPFFAAASNVLLPPLEVSASEVPSAGGGESSVPCPASVWIGGSGAGGHNGLAAPPMEKLEPVAGADVQASGCISAPGGEGSSSNGGALDGEALTIESMKP